ncbi:hypothetical protein LC608_36400 [Nostoc sp. XA010]|uniref:hypothetical protein n=1 Tax=Nostoc sp. XA010 TaxID=2780407 RepID=UPI001E3F890A|nr:hypothetical protein [Nostoc sp. XA010]MCC5662290.1 hypothetical protein [Nostoc sp. XA010]
MPLPLAIQSLQSCNVRPTALLKRGDAIRVRASRRQALAQPSLFFRYVGNGENVSVELQM